ncbi:LPXTG cell wall anchor domain-containing protein, partial [bacterium]|nr:LPXTG cell wall anchor domain-containing protein [bacterium]
YGGGYQYPMQQPTASTGISTNTLLLVGAAGLIAYLIFRKK